MSSASRCSLKHDLASTFVVLQPDQSAALHRKERESDEEEVCMSSACLSTLLHGEDPGFVRYVEHLHAQAQRS